MIAVVYDKKKGLIFLKKAETKVSAFWFLKIIFIAFSSIS